MWRVRAHSRALQRDAGQRAEEPGEQAVIEFDPILSRRYQEGGDF